jgi:hypothetical protein
LAISPRIHLKITSFKKYKNIKNKFNIVDGSSYIPKMVEIQHKKNLNYTSLIYILNFQKI